MFYLICQIRNFALYPAGVFEEQKPVREGPYENFFREGIHWQIKIACSAFFGEHAFELNFRAMARTGKLTCHFEQNNANFLPPGSSSILLC